MKTEYVLKSIPFGSRYSLTNDGALEIVPIGVGSMLAQSRFNTNFLAVKGDTHLMIDCGRTAPEALRAIGLSPVDIVNILPTHLHDDHVAGIGTLAVWNRYIGRLKMKKPKINIVAPGPFANLLYNQTLKGTLATNEAGENNQGLGFNDWFDLTEPELVVGSEEFRETYHVNFGGIDLQIFRTMHVPDTAKSWRDSAWSTGILIDQKVLVSGDTRFDAEMIRTYADQSQLIFHDAALFDDKVHASIGQLRTLQSEVKGKMHLIHYGDNWPEHSIEGFAGWAQQGVRYVMEK